MSPRFSVLLMGLIASAFVGFSCAKKDAADSGFGTAVASSARWLEKVTLVRPVARDSFVVEMHQHFFGGAGSIDDTARYVHSFYFERFFRTLGKDDEIWIWRANTRLTSEGVAIKRGGHIIFSLPVKES